MSPKMQSRSGPRAMALSGKIAAALLASTLLTATAAAQTAEEKGLEIAQEIDRRDLGWGDSTVQMKMVLRNRNGDASTRELRLKTLEITEPGFGDRSLLIFDQPRDIEGTAFLSHTRVSEPDDQWLYLPALKRVKRISSANKSGPFVGSEFAYEDLLSQEVDKYEYKWLRDEPCGDLECFVFERYPVYKNSGYTKHVVWVDTEEYRIARIDFYDRKESLLKTLVMTDYQQYLDTYWRAGTLEMENLQTGKSTSLVFDGYEFKIGLNDSDFASNRLKRVR